MVGVPRSTGCSICIKRRIKCDEGRPECANCLKYGTACPGYDKGLKFVVGKPHRTKRPRSKSSPRTKVITSPVTVKSTLTSPAASTVDSPPWFQEHQFSFENSFSLSGNQDYPDTTDTDEMLIDSPTSHDLVVQKSPSPMEIVPTIPAAMSNKRNYQMRLVSALCDHLPRPTGRNEIRMITDWLQRLPSRFGYSQALDSAMMCFTAQQIGTTCNDMQMMREGRDSYIEALKLLQRSLGRSQEAKQADTLCAAMLLCIYELFAGTTSHDSWLKHAAGLGRLLQYRGPRSFRAGYDHSLLRAVRGLVVMESMSSGKVCFLTQPEWREVQRMKFDDTLDDEFHTFFEDFYAMLSEMPTLLAKGAALRDAFKRGEVIQVDDVDVSKLAEKSLACYGRLTAWSAELHRRIPYPEGRPNAHSDPLFPVTYHFVSNSAAGLYCNFWTCMIIVQEILLTCGFQPEDAIDSAEYAQRICMCTEYMSGSWGGFKMGFCLRIAYEMAGPELKRWIGEWHLKQSQVYAATSLAALPQDEEIKELVR